MASNIPKTGIWYDCERSPFNRYQVLVSEQTAQIPQVILAVLLTLVWPCLFKILRRFWAWIFKFCSWSRDQLRKLSSDGPTNAQLPVRERAPLLHSNQEEDPTTTYNHAHNGRGTVLGFLKTVIALAKGEKKLTMSQWTAMIVITTIVFIVFVAHTFATVFSTRIDTDRTALSSSKHCGIWMFDDRKAGHEAASREDLRDYAKEDRASQYARNCYNTPTSGYANGCDYFYNQSISYSSYRKQPCPFQEPSLCLNGLYSAVTFDTGLVDARAIGINTAERYKFRRRSTCSPLNISEPYIRPGSPDISNGSEYYYYYGSTDRRSYTFRTSGSPFEWLVPVYSVDTYFSSLYPTYDYWRPIPELTPPPNNTLTIMFVSSMHIYHETASFDPIFLATTPKHIDGYRHPYYYNSDNRARPWACVDSTELCHVKGKKSCWSMASPLPRHVPNKGAYWLMKWSLEESNMYQSIKYRLGSALLATRNVAQYVSTPLSPQQWEIEADHLFATSLARVQFEAKDIATGEDRGLPGYVEVTPNEGRDRLCDSYKYKAHGYININLVAYIGICLVAVAIWVLSWKAPDTGTGGQEEDFTEKFGDRLLVDIVAVWLWNAVIWFSRGMRTCYRILSRLAIEGVGKCKSLLGRH